MYQQSSTCLCDCIAGEALQCVSCVREAPDSGDCVETVENCPPEMDTCAKIAYPAPYGEYSVPLILVTSKDKPKENIFTDVTI